jgi:hypothetical protein
MKIAVFIVLIISIQLTSCKVDKSQEIIDDAIKAHGGVRFDNAFIEFDFRGRHYTSRREKGLFTYTREFKDSTGNVKDVLTNDGFHREINGGLAKISSERANAYKNSVNSVLYFALLPYGLNDPSVNKVYFKESELKGKKYHVVRITFKKEGGGKDHDDIFLYWINQETDHLDYFAYSYLTDGGGVRFREAINPKTIDGIRFQDYVNYQPKKNNVTLEDMELLFEHNELDTLSIINHENIKVKLLD